MVENSRFTNRHGKVVDFPVRESKIDDADQLCREVLIEMRKAGLLDPTLLHKKVWEVAMEAKSILETSVELPDSVENALKIVVDEMEKIKERNIAAFYLNEQVEAVLKGSFGKKIIAERRGMNDEDWNHVKRINRDVFGDSLREVRFNKDTVLERDTTIQEVLVDFINFLKKWN